MTSSGSLSVGRSALMVSARFLALRRFARSGSATMMISSMVARVWRTQRVPDMRDVEDDDRHRLLAQLDDLLELALGEVEGAVEDDRRGQQVDVVGRLAHQAIEHASGPSSGWR